MAKYETVSISKKINIKNLTHQIGIITNVPEAVSCTYKFLKLFYSRPLELYISSPRELDNYVCNCCNNDNTSSINEQFIKNPISIRRNNLNISNICSTVKTVLSFMKNKFYCDKWSYNEHPAYYRFISNAVEDINITYSKISKNYFIVTLTLLVNNTVNNYVSTPFLILDAINSYSCSYNVSPNNKACLLYVRDELLKTFKEDDESISDIITELNEKIRFYSSNSNSNSNSNSEDENSIEEWTPNYYYDTCSLIRDIVNVEPPVAEEISVPEYLFPMFFR